MAPNKLMQRSLFAAEPAKRQGLAWDYPPPSWLLADGRLVP